MTAGLLMRRNQLKCGPRMTAISHLLSLWKPLPCKQPKLSEHLNYSCKYPEPCGYPRPLLHIQVNKAPLCLITSSLVTPSFYLPVARGLCLKNRGHRLDPRRGQQRVVLALPALLTRAPWSQDSSGGCPPAALCCWPPSPSSGQTTSPKAYVQSYRMKYRTSQWIFKMPWAICLGELFFLEEL